MVIKVKTSILFGWRGVQNEMHHGITIRIGACSTPLDYSRGILLFWKTNFKEYDDPSGFQSRALVGVVNRGGAIGGDGKNGIRITRTVWNLHAG